MMSTVIQQLVSLPLFWTCPHRIRGRVVIAVVNNTICGVFYRSLFSLPTRPYCFHFFSLKYSTLERPPKRSRLSQAVWFTATFIYGCFGRPPSLHCAFHMRVLPSQSDINDDVFRSTSRCRTFGVTTHSKLSCVGYWRLGLPYIP